MSRDPKLFLQDILDAIRKVDAFIGGRERAAFEADAMAYDAVLRNLEVIGEAAKRLPADLTDLAPEIPWRLICGFRDHLAHAYFGLDDDTIWDVVSLELKELERETERLLTSLPPEPGP